MPQVRIILLRALWLGFGAILGAGCTVTSQPPSSEPSKASIPPELAAKSPPPEAAAAPRTEPAVPPQPEPAMTQRPEPTVAPQAAPAVVAPASVESAGVAAPDTSRPSAPAVSRPPAAPPGKSVATAPSAPKPPSAVPQKPPGPPPLDLKSLETRLKDTKAIGVYTKLTLKNQVDDLLDDFRAYYKGQAKTTLAELRRAFDLLVMKVLALLQDADPQLASAIADSREAIWGILSDPVKFAAV